MQILAKLPVKNDNLTTKQDLLELTVQPKKIIFFNGFLCMTFRYVTGVILAPSCVGA